MNENYIVLCGGVGGSKLAQGLTQILTPEQLTIVVNTGDDFDHLGLRICPDIDTVTYMLSNLVHRENGWGRNDETWSSMETLKVLGGETWFQLGDKDIGLHLFRTEQLRQQKSLSEITNTVREKFGIKHQILPMSEAPVRTVLETTEGTLSFQDYFVRRRCEPVVTKVRYDGIEQASPSKEFLQALASPNLKGILIAPSNPILSVAPILELVGLKDLIANSGVPVVAVSPLIGGKSVKGPAAKLMNELGHSSDNPEIANFYSPFLSGLVIDDIDAGQSRQLSVPSLSGDILMKNADDRKKVAQMALTLLEKLQQ